MSDSGNKAAIGLIGLGTMGSALALNIADNGYKIAVTNRTVSRVSEFINDAGELSEYLIGCDDIESFVASLQTPRAIIVMVPAGKPFDDQIEALKPYLDEGDTLIDAGNTNFHDTRRRDAELAADGFRFVGMGVSGGEEGARFGPSIMVGGPEESFKPIEPIINAIAAKYEGDPCAAHLGPDGAGHFVKTVHNGIEYADMQLIAEVWGILRDGQGKSAAEVGALFDRWNEGELKSYLVEITGKALGATDEATGKPVVDIILDRAGQKGTGRWTVIEALGLGQSASTIEAAVGARSWSAAKDVREAGAEILAVQPEGGPQVSEEDLADALLAARILAYAQGFDILTAASETYGWDLDMARVAEIWRAGCIIRSALLDDISAAFRGELPKGRLILAPAFAKRLVNGSAALRRVVASAAMNGQATPAFSAALAYFDTMRTARGTTDLVQAQRDFFGAHGFERVDQEGGGFHGPWALSAEDMNVSR
ncbi:MULTISPECIES: NADP-dependent phosphogluconate dehydrogenase [Halocynthiibacter]|uniref:6-phosphogluconate dehydrogenase, decarboxylating n=1 Tax=Halocynthiibacter halioticoli TaxID=2986804 RepID=A0AAE3LR60_9RHOB|nr:MULTISPECIES: NADP-dependent phosphogluconate dehydrogenase [Halocynthiibacter]MCV6825222.1 NADP-dependent phosphogluconate dehydrogenase [Halocynthiibacter halioticoli]MCW4058223.1 NADP-dependent phosphogluconate dehydrogenase [Halocynthiibacter sp. SDUM655004]